MRTNIVGQEAPRFVLENEHGETFDSSVLDGSWRIVFFYSRNNSPTCKRGCLTFKEQHDLFSSVGCSIVGIGPGTRGTGRIQSLHRGLAVPVAGRS